MGAAATALNGCGAPKADIPPAQVTIKMKPLSPAEAKGLAMPFLSELESMPKAKRGMFVARHARDVAAVKALNDPDTTSRFQADLSGK